MTNKEKNEKKARNRILSLFKKRRLQHIKPELLDVIEVDGMDHAYNLQEMEDEIFQNALLAPLSVCGPYPNGHYYIIDGARRLNAIMNMEFLGKELGVPCYVIECDNLSKKDITLLAIKCNTIKRNDISMNVVYTEQLLDLSAEGVIAKKDVSKMLSQQTGMSDRQARKYRSIVENGSSSLLDSFKDKRISINAAEMIAKKPEDEQEELIEQFEGLNYGEKSKAILENGGYAGYISGNNNLNKKLAETVLVGKVTNTDVSDKLNQLVEKSLSEEISDFVRTGDKILSLDKKGSRIKKDPNYDELIRVAHAIYKKFYLD